MRRATTGRADGRALAAALAVVLVGGTTGAHAELVRPGRLEVLRAGQASATAVDLGGPERDGRVPLRLASGRHSVAARLALPGRHASAPVAWGGGVAVGTSNGLWLGGGAVAPRLLELGPIDARPVVLPSGELLVATRDGTLRVLDGLGRTVRSARASASVRTSPLVLDDGSVVVTSLDRTVARFDAALEPVFALTLPSGLVHAAARLSSERLVVAAGERLHVLDLAGSLLRTIDLGDRAVAPPAVDDAGDVHVLLAQGVVAVIAHGAHVRARHALGARVLDQTAMLAIAEDGSYRLAIPAVGIVALETDGTRRWEASTDAPFYGPLAIDGDGTTLAFDRRGRLAVISPDGELLERIELGGLAQGHPLLAEDGSLWVTTDAPEVVQIARAAP
jgi:hypothetical protein